MHAIKYKYIIVLIFSILTAFTMTACDELVTSDTISDEKKIIVMKNELDSSINDKIINLAKQTFNLQLEVQSSYSSYTKSIKFIALDDFAVNLNTKKTFEITFSNKITNIYLFRKKINENWIAINSSNSTTNKFEDQPSEDNSYSYLILAYYDNNIYYGLSDNIKYVKSNLMQKISFDIPGIYLGFMSESEYANDIKNLTNLTHPIDGFFVSFLENSQEILPSKYETRLANIKQANRVAFITWEPWDTNDKTKNIMGDIAIGKYDTFLTNWATELAKYAYPVIIRFAHEMNGDWYPWANDAINYKKAFIKVVNIFRQNGAYNVSFCFAPNHNDGGTGKDYKDFFPGLDYVDCLGISGYNWGTSQSWSSWSSFYEIFYPMVNDLTNNYNLPIILDVASSETGGNKATWLADMAKILKNHTKFARVKAFAWFCYNKETDWRIKSSNDSINSYSSAFADNKFLQTITYRYE